MDLGLFLAIAVIWALAVSMLHHFSKPQTDEEEYNHQIIELLYWLEEMKLKANIVMLAMSCDGHVYTVSDLVTYEGDDQLYLDVYGPNPLEEGREYMPHTDMIISLDNIKHVTIQMPRGINNHKVVHIDFNDCFIPVEFDEAEAYKDFNESI